MEDAIENNDMAKVQALLAAGEDVNKVYSGGRTALTLASFEGFVDIVELLIEKGADINKQDQSKDTALILSVYKGNYELTKLLIDKGAQLDTIDGAGYTALLIATADGHAEIAKLLVEKGAKLDIQDESGKTALMYALEGRDSELAKLLIEKGANIEIEDESGSTALIFACLNGDLEIVELLIEKGANIDVENDIGGTPLISASVRGRVDIVKLLIEKGVELNTADNDGNTALILASFGGHVDVVKLLIEKGAAIDVENGEEQTALDVAKTDEIRRLLQSALPAQPAAAVPAKEPKELEYTEEPMCFDMLENGDISVLQALTSGKTVFKIGNVYNSTETRVLLEQLEKNENLRYKCKQESVELRTLTPNDVDMDKVYYLLTLVGNYMVDMKELVSSLQAGYRVFELTEMGDEVEFTASRDVLYDSRTGLNLNGQELNYIGADHCQKGTNRKPYSLEPLSFIKKKAGGRKTYRRKPSTRRRKTYRK